jgi:hypothetical protein
MNGRDGTAGGLPIKGYVVRVFENGKANRKIKHDSKKREIVVTGLRRGSFYVFKIAAVNDKGVGYYSAPSKPVRVK